MKHQTPNINTLFFIVFVLESNYCLRKPSQHFVITYRKEKSCTEIHFSKKLLYILYCYMCKVRSLSTFELLSSFTPSFQFNLMMQIKIC